MYSNMQFGTETSQDLTDLLSAAHSMLQRLYVKNYLFTYLLQVLKDHVVGDNALKLTDKQKYQDPQQEQALDKQREKNTARRNEIQEAQ